MAKKAISIPSDAPIVSITQSNAEETRADVKDWWYSSVTEYRAAITTDQKARRGAPPAPVPAEATTVEEECEYCILC